MSDVLSNKDNEQEILNYWDEYEKLESIEDKQQKLEVIKEKLESLEIDKAKLDKHDKRLYSEEVLNIKIAFSEHIRSVERQVIALENEIQSQLNDIKDLKKNYYANIISIMGIFLAIFALILGNIQILQNIQSESIARIILYVYISTSFIVIAVTVLMILVENILKGPEEHMDLSLHSKIIWTSLLIIPFFYLWLCI